MDGRCLRCQHSTMQKRRERNISLPIDIWCGHRKMLTVQVAWVTNHCHVFFIIWSEYFRTNVWKIIWESSKNQKIILKLQNCKNIALRDTFYPIEMGHTTEQMPGSNSWQSNPFQHWCNRAKKMWAEFYQSRVGWGEITEVSFGYFSFSGRSSRDRQQGQCAPLAAILWHWKSSLEDSVPSPVLDRATLKVNKRSPTECFTNADIFWVVMLMWVSATTK